MNFDAARVLEHPRVAALHPESQVAYLRLLGAADVTGHVPDAAATPALAACAAPQRRLDELAAAGLVDDEPHRAGFWVVRPETCDAAEVFADA